MSEVWGHAIFVFSQSFPIIIFPDILEFSPLTFIFLIFKGVIGIYVSEQGDRYAMGPQEMFSFMTTLTHKSLQLYCFTASILAIVLFYSFKEPPLLFGVLQPNTKLRQAERLFENQLSGPESLVNIGGK